MKYKIIQNLTLYTGKFYQFEDENGNRRYSWTIYYPEYYKCFPTHHPMYSDIATGGTIFASNDQIYRIRAVIELNEDNPEESFDRIVKLQILK